MSKTFMGDSASQWFSVWKKLVEAVARLKHLAVTHHHSDFRKQKQSVTGFVTVAVYTEAERLLLSGRSTQLSYMDI